MRCNTVLGSVTSCSLSSTLNSGVQYALNRKIVLWLFFYFYYLFMTVHSIMHWMDLKTSSLEARRVTVECSDGSWRLKFQTKSSSLSHHVWITLKPCKKSLNLFISKIPPYNQPFATKHSQATPQAFQCSLCKRHCSRSLLFLPCLHPRTTFPLGTSKPFQGN